MFSKKIVSSARFLRMSATARLLYYDLGMYADDDGVVEAFTVVQMTHAAMDDLHILVARGFVEILNEDMVSYICDWKLNNFVRKDRYTPSIYQALLLRSTTGQPAVNLDENRIDQNRIDQIRLDEERIDETSVAEIDVPPTVRECFINSFEREPDKPFLDTISKLLGNGISEKQVICQICESAPRKPRRPEAYIISALKVRAADMQIKEQTQENTLSAWETDWLESIRRYQTEQQNQSDE